MVIRHARSPRPASGPGSRYTARAATSRFRPARHTDVAVLARLLTTRDQWLTRMLHEHRVLTTHQIAALAYTSPAPHSDAFAPSTNTQSSIPSVP